MEVFNSEIVVAGGYEGRNIVEHCEAFDWRSNSWRPMPKMTMPRSALYLQNFDGLDICQRFLGLRHENDAETIENCVTAIEM